MVSGDNYDTNVKPQHGVAFLNATDYYVDKIKNPEFLQGFYICCFPISGHL